KWHISWGGKRDSMPAHESGMQSGRLQPAGRAFVREGEYYLNGQMWIWRRGVDALETALQLFLEQAEIAISTSIGGIVAKLDDVFVRTEKQGVGFGTTLLEQLNGALAKAEVRRIDTSVHLHNGNARLF